MNRRGDQTLPRPPTGLHLGWFAHRHHERQLHQRVGGAAQSGEGMDCGDVEQVTDALVELLGTLNLREMYRPGFEEVKGQFTWERALEPQLS